MRGEYGSREEREGRDGKGMIGKGWDESDA